MRLTEAHIDEFIGLLLYICQKHSKSNTVSHWDMLQASYKGLAEALKSFDKSKKVPLKSWVYLVVNSEVIRCRYRKNKETREHSGYDDLFFNQLEGQSLPPDQQMILNELEAERSKRFRDVYRIMKRVTEGDSLNREIYIQHIIRGKQIKKIAEEMNMTYPAVSHRIGRITAKIREEFKNNIVSNQPGIDKK